MTTQKRIIEILEDNKFWLPYGKMKSCFIIEERPPFFWRFNPRWLKEKAKEIIKEINYDGKK